MKKQQIRDLIATHVKRHPVLSKLTDGEVRHVQILLEQVLKEQQKDMANEARQARITPEQQSKIDLADRVTNLLRDLWQQK
jgi:hypothetical protein